MKQCSHHAYAAARSFALGAGASADLVAQAADRGWAALPHPAYEFALLALRDVERRIPERSKIHVCRACRRCATASAADGRLHARNVMLDPAPSSAAAVPLAP
jgi:hypothetical protein